MARQSRSTSTAAQTPDAVEGATPNEENPVTTTDTPPAEGTEAVTPPAEGDKPAETPIDLAPFQALVNKAVEGREADTGVLTDEVKASIKAAYNELDGKAGHNEKQEAKNWSQDQMMKAVAAVDGPLARAFSQVIESLVASGARKSGTPAVPADPSAAYVQRRAAQILAEGLVKASAPESDKDLEALAAEAATAAADDVAKFQAWVDLTPDEGTEKPDAPEVSPLVRAAFKLATGKASGGGRAAGASGPRGDIAKHVTEFFADKEVGTPFKVSEVANFKSTEYPAGNASQGAISSRLFPSGGGPTTIPGVTPIAKDSTGPNRVAKA